MFDTYKNKTNSFTRVELQVIGSNFSKKLLHFILDLIE